MCIYSYVVVLMYALVKVPHNYSADTRIISLPLSPLGQAMCDLVQSTSPVSVLGSQLEQLPDEHRALLKEILRLFGLVRTGLTKILG